MTQKLPDEVIFCIYYEVGIDDSKPLGQSEN